MNAFVDYLNSMNNATGDTMNSLAESQVLNPFYKKIQVERKLGKYMLEQIKSVGNQVFIITGHAGDGKTSILVQLLNDLGMIEPGQGLKDCEVVEKNDLKIRYVKDMSELSESRQEELLRLILSAPDRNESAVLVGNTGPIINTFMRVITDFAKFEDQLLTQLDKNKVEEVLIEDYKFHLVNIARVDNVSFTGQIINNIIMDELWDPCKRCQANLRCPIHFNYSCLKKHRDRVVRFVESYYRYLYEIDKRMTIRQVISQISYAITSNLTCQHVIQMEENEFVNYNYNFANAFFGFAGLKRVDSAFQIRGIEELNRLKLDMISLEADYEMFINNDMLCFDEDIRSMLLGVMNHFNKRYHSLDVDDRKKKNQEDEKLLRRSIRRFYLLYSLVEDKKEIDLIEEQIFGYGFPDYRKAISNKVDFAFKRKLKRLVFEALYIDYCGGAPHGESSIYLTLRRNKAANQNVMFLLGEIKDDQLEVQQVNLATSYEDVSEKYLLQLEFGKQTFELNLAFIQYFWQVRNGRVSTSLSPSMSHGIARLNTALLNCFGKRNTGEEMRLLAVTNMGSHVIRGTFEGNKLHIE